MAADGSKMHCKIMQEYTKIRKEYMCVNYMKNFPKKI